MLKRFLDPRIAAAVPALVGCILVACGSSGDSGDSGNPFDAGTSTPQKDASVVDSSIGAGHDKDAAAPKDAGAPSDASTGNAECLIYLIDLDSVLWSMRPNQTDVTKSIITRVGDLDCTDDTSIGPWAMAVARDGTAWIEYGNYAGAADWDEKIFKADTRTGHCTDSGYKPSHKIEAPYDMAFSTNGAGSTDETMFIATSIIQNPPLGTFDTKTLTNAPMANAQLEAEAHLSGTSEGRLFGFAWHGVDAGPFAGLDLHMAEIDKTTGSEIKSYPLPSDATIYGGPVYVAQATAFAMWGGDGWVFIINMGTHSTTAYQVKPKDGSTKMWSIDGKAILVAGASTCAPTTEQPPPANPN